MNEEILSETDYGTAWKDNGQTFVKFPGSDRIYEITEGESERAIDYTLVQTLGSCVPTRDFRRYLENREA